MISKPKFSTNSKGKAVRESDTYLTPPKFLAAFGPFDMDVCCPPNMPWETAPVMLTEVEDGLATPWVGRVWCNPPYSNILPWVHKMAAHGNGLLLTPSKSLDTRWGQRIIETADAVLFLKGRLSFFRADGSPTTGTWSPYMVAAYGLDNVQALRTAVTAGYMGVVMIRQGVEQ